MSNLTGERFRTAALGNRWAQEYIHLSAFDKGLSVEFTQDILGADKLLRDPTVSNDDAVMAHTQLAIKLEGARKHAQAKQNVDQALDELRKVLAAFNTPSLIGVPSSKAPKGRSLPPDGTVLTTTDARAKGATCKIEGGQVVYGGRTFGSLSAAAMAVVADHDMHLKAVNGWTFWGAN